VAAAAVVAAATVAAAVVAVGTAAAVVVAEGVAAAEVDAGTNRSISNDLSGEGRSIGRPFLFLRAAAAARYERNLSPSHNPFSATGLCDIR
jgi:hypothetical protein